MYTKTKILILLSILNIAFFNITNCYAEATPKVVLVETKNEAKSWEKGRKYALIIGISDYSVSNIPKLKYAANDAIEVNNFFSNESSIKYDEVVLLINDQANRKNILQKLSDILNKIGNQDTLFIYYSGHGKEDFLIPYDGDMNYLKATCIRWKQDIFNEINTIDVKQKILIIDSCHSGSLATESMIAMEKGDSREISINDKLLDQMGRGLFIITSSRENEISWENDTIKHGYFTYYLVEGLKGYADKTGETSFGNGDGYVTADELYNFVSYKTNDAVLKDLRKTQHPRKSFYGEGVIYLSKRSGNTGFEPNGFITIKSDPEGDVYVDGIKIGSTPIKEKEIFSGEHQLKIVKDGYITINENILISSNEKKVFDMELKAESAFITINTVPWGYVYIDGSNYFGETPIRTGKIASGEHIIEIIPQSKKFKSIKQKINISSKNDNFFSWELEKIK